MGQGLVSQELIRQIKERTDITELVGNYVSLTRTGQNLKGLCPFHAEKTPSFTVSPSRQVFHCFGCGVGGDVFAFLMKRENFGFIESVRELARRAGIHIPLSPGMANSQDDVNRERIWKTNAAAAAWFRRNLLDPEAGKEGRDYLESRGIRPETAEAFGLGLARSSWDGLIASLRKEAFTVSDLAAAGLVVAKDHEHRQRRHDTDYYDRFRGRLMFPIHDLHHRVMAFGGRVLGEGLPKYLNSPDLPIFKKGSALYGLDRAREAAWRTGSLVIVEGYFDAVALHQAGITNVVATLGTALTPDHVRALRRFASKVSLIFDPDPAGVRAAVRTLDLFRDSGIGVRVVCLPEGDDPDTFLRRAGAEAFSELEARAPSLVEFSVEQSVRRAASGNLEDRIHSVDEVLRVLQKTDNRIEKEECLRVVAEQLGISQQGLIGRYPELLRKDRSARDRKAGRTTEAGRPPQGGRGERELVGFLLRGQLNANQIQSLDPEAFTVPALRKIVELSAQYRDAEGLMRTQDLLQEVLNDQECGPVATELSLSEEHYEDFPAYIQGCLETLERKRREQCLSELIGKLRAAEKEGRIEEAHRLNAEVNELRIKKAFGVSPAV